MTKLQEVLNTYEREFHKLGIKYDIELLKKVTQSCGPAIYNADASKVSTSDNKELIRVKNNFLIKKLGLQDTPKLDEGISSVIKIFGSDNRNKYRAMFYYLLMKEFHKDSIYEKKKSIGLSNYYNKIVDEDANLMKRLAK